MRRIGLAIVLTLGLSLAPLAANAEQAASAPRIGFLSASSPSVAAHLVEAFRQGLRNLGYVEGQNIVVEYRWAEFRLERLPALATELVQRKVDVFLTAAGGETGAAMRATQTIPIVMAYSLDAVELRLVASLAHPGGNVTGLTSMTSELNRKRLELLTQAAPKTSRIAVLLCKGIEHAVQGLGGTLAAADALRVQPQILEVREVDDYEIAFAAAIRERVAAMVVFNCYFNGWNSQRIVALAAKYRLPAMYSWKEAVENGGLMSYGSSSSDMFRRAAVYVDKILKGAKPANLPVEQPTKIELVINLKTAKALGLTVPQSLLLRADQVIE